MTDETVNVTNCLYVPTSYDEIARLRELVTELDEQCKNERRWAKVWKAKAKHTRKGWKMDSKQMSWRRRRAWLELYESGR